VTTPSGSTQKPPGPTCAAWPRSPDGSGKTNGRVKAHDGGDRQANSALWRIVMVRIAHDPETQIYLERRVKEGKTKHEVIRILKRYVARELYRFLPRG
jgi:transposase